MTNPNSNDSPTSSVSSWLDSIKANLAKYGAIAAVVLVVLILVYIAGSCSNNTALDQWKTKYNTYRDSVTVLIKQNQAVVAQNDTLQKQKTALLGTADSLDRVNATLKSTVVTLHTNNQVLLQQLSQIPLDTTIQKTIRGLVAEIALKDSIIHNDSLDRVNRENAMVIFNRQYNDLAMANANLLLANQKLPGAPPSNKLLGLIPLPSPQTTFFLGIGVAIVGDLAFHGLKDHRVQL